MDVQTLKGKIREATLERSTFRVQVLKLLLGEFERIQYGGGNPTIGKIAEKLIDANNECLRLLNGSGDSSKLVFENTILSEFVPKYATIDEILEVLAKAGFTFTDKKSIGQAMKIMRESGLTFDPKMVQSLYKGE